MRLIKATKHSLVTLFAVRSDNKSELTKAIVLNSLSTPCGRVTVSLVPGH